MSQPLDLSPLWISLATTSAATAATFVLGLAAARWMYARRGPLRAWLDGLLTLPLVLPPTVVGFFLLLLLGRRSPIGQLLAHLGVVIVFSWPATVIAATIVAFPLMYRTALGALDQVNPALAEAARTLGASEPRVFLRILVPLAWPGIVAGAVLSFARALGEFGATLMLAGNIPGRTQTMPIAIFSAAEGGDMRSAALWVALIVALSLAIVRLLNLEARNRTRPAPPPPAEPGSLIPLPPPSRPSNAEPRLHIDLERQLAAFRLRVNLEAGLGPVGLLGASGAGKSLTLKMIAGIAAPSAGRILLNGRTLYDSAAGVNLPPAQRRVGMVFQDYALFPHLTVAGNVAFGLPGPAAEREQRAHTLLERMGIAELAHHYPGQISGGQRQRVAIARTLAAEPDALLLDEPFAALDPHLRRRMEEQLRRDLAVFQGPVLMVTHDMEEAFRFCQSLIVLDHGRVIASGPRNDLFANPRTAAAARLTGCKNIASARSVPGAGEVDVEPWECRLALDREPPAHLTAIGFRSHHLRFVHEPGGVNRFSCWLVETSEAPHEVTLYLRLHRPPAPGEPAHLQADLPRQQWLALQDRPQPWTLELDPCRILLLEN